MLTITIDPTVESALTLGLIVLVRTFLSFSLEIELAVVHGELTRRLVTTGHFQLICTFA